MNFTALEKKYANFYAPAFEILVEGKNLREMGLEITSVKVDQMLEGADYFTFEINNMFDLGQGLKPLLPVGKKVSIRMGYGRQLEPVLTGVITSMTTQFQAAHSPRLVVTGFDLSYPMTKGMGSDSWDRVQHSDVAVRIAEKYGLKSKVDPTEVVYPKVMKRSDKSDFEFLQKLAADNYFEFSVFGDTLYFRKPQYELEAVVELEWQKQLLYFSPEINVAGYMTEVEIRGWNPKTKKEIVGKAKAGHPLGNPRELTGGKLVQSLLRQPETLSLRHPVFSQQEAEKLAKAILNKHNEGLITGEGETIGLPDIMPGRIIRLNGLGSTFSKSYYIEKSVHHISAGRGYLTTFHVKESVL